MRLSCPRGSDAGSHETWVVRAKTAFGGRAVSGISSDHRETRISSPGASLVRIEAPLQVKSLWVVRPWCHQM